MDGGSRYFGNLARFLRTFALSMMLKSLVMTWPAGLYLNGEFRQEQSGGLAFKSSVLKVYNTLYKVLDAMSEE